MLDLDLQQILSQAISFVLLLVVLKKFAWKPLLGVLDERRRHIEEELRQIAQSKTEMARLQQEYSQRLAAIESEARTKIQQAVLDGKRIGMEIQDQARAQGQEILTKSKETIELEVAKAKVTLRDQVAGMALDAVERILRRKLDPQADRKLVDAVLDELDERTPARA